MILQALVSHYEALVAAKKLDPPGWSKQKVSYCICLGDNGEVLQIITLTKQVQRGNTFLYVPQEHPLPSSVKRTVGVAANFLCDNSGYILGIDNKGKPERSAECHRACVELHEKLLDGVESPSAQAVLAFFRHFDPSRIKEMPAFDELLDDIVGGGNIIFAYDDDSYDTENDDFPYVHNDPEVRAAWDRYYSSSDADSLQRICLVTGRLAPIEAVHPSIKGIIGAQWSGAALVSFNAPAFCSYGKEQNLNAPTGKYAAFAYTSALNYLIADKTHSVLLRNSLGRKIPYATADDDGSTENETRLAVRVGDTTVLFWADDAEPVYKEVFFVELMGICDKLFGTSNEDSKCEEKHYSNKEIFDKIQKLLRGEVVEFNDTYLDPNRTFYVLGITPNSARLSVRFFFANTFGAFLRNVQAHYDRMEIARPSFDSNVTVSVWNMLRETVNENSRDKAPSPNMSGAVLRSVLTDTRYPTTLLNSIELRIRADHRIDRERAAIIKAYYLKNEHREVPKEVLTVSLNRETDYVPYCLGRLFAIYEKIQSDASPELNSTVKDRYFSSASATPALIFPRLEALSQSHIKKLLRDKPEYAFKLLREREEVMDKLVEVYPVRMTLHEQGSFQLGYYHQVIAFYTKKQKEDTENV